LSAEMILRFYTTASLPPRSENGRCFHSNFCRPQSSVVEVFPLFALLRSCPSFFTPLILGFKRPQGLSERLCFPPRPLLSLFQRIYCRTSCSFIQTSSVPDIATPRLVIFFRRPLVIHGPFAAMSTLSYVSSFRSLVFPSHGLRAPHRFVLVSPFDSRFLPFSTELSCPQSHTQNAPLTPSDDSLRPAAGPSKCQFVEETRCLAALSRLFPPESSGTFLTA